MALAFRADGRRCPCSHERGGPRRGYNVPVFEELKRVLESDRRVAYALAFGSAARGTAHAHSDVDVAIGVAGRRRLAPLEIGEIVSKLETATGGRPVDLVLLDDAPPGLAYRIFRDGRVLVARDRTALVDRKVRAILEYLDFQPVEEQLTRGVLAAARRGR